MPRPLLSSSSSIMQVRHHNPSFAQRLLRTVFREKLWSREVENVDRMNGTIPCNALRMPLS